VGPGRQPWQTRLANATLRRNLKAAFFPLVRRRGRKAGWSGESGSASARDRGTARPEMRWTKVRPSPLPAACCALSSSASHVSSPLPFPFFCRNPVTQLKCPCFAKGAAVARPLPVPQAGVAGGIPSLSQTPMITADNETVQQVRRPPSRAQKENAPARQAGSPVSADFNGPGGQAK
jgi:hypothetical protein